MSPRIQLYHPPFQGTIIVDTGVLIRLSPETEKHSHHHFTDILPQLAHQGGYQIIIPEIVAYETSRVLPSGRCVDDIFTRSKPKEGMSPEQRHREILKKPLKDGLMHFLSAVAQRTHDPDLVLEHAAPTPVKEYIQARESDMNLSQKSRSRAIARIQEAGKPDKDFGDDAIKHIMKRSIAENLRDKPIYILSNDRKFFRRFSNSLSRSDGYPADIRFLNTNSFVDGIVKSGLGKRFGISKDRHVEEINDSRRRAVVRAFGNAYNEPTYVDCSAENYSELNLNNKAYVDRDAPFHKAMVHLAELLHKHDPHPPEHIHTKRERSGGQGHGHKI